MLVLSLPLAVDPGGFQRHIALRWALLGVIVTIGAWSARGSLWRTVPRPVMFAWAALLLTVALSSFAAVAPLPAVIGESHRRAGLLSFVVVASAFALGAAVRPHRTLVVRVAPVATGVVFLAVLATLGTQDLATSRAVLVGNSGQLGGYLAILGGVNLVVATTDPDRRWRRVGAVGGALALCLVLLTGSYAAVIAGVVLLGLFAIHHGAGRAARPWWAVAAGGATALTVVALVWPAQFRALGPSVQGRIDTWVVSLEVVFARPLLGWGPEGFRHGFALLVPDSFVSDWGDLRVQDRAHSLPLDHAAASGLLGLAALVFLVIAVAASILRDGDRQDRAVGVVLVAAGVFLAGWFLEFDLAAVLAVLAGLAIAPGSRPAHPTVMRSLTITVLVAGVLVTAVGVIAVVEDRRFRGALHDAEELVGSQPGVTRDDPGSDGLDEHQADPLRPLRRATAPTAGYTEMLAAIKFAPAASLDQLELALTDIEGASSWHDPGRDAEVALVHAQVHLERARRLADQQAIDQAEDAFRDVLRLAPNHSFAWRGLATSRLMRKDPAARDALMVLAELRPTDVGVRHDLAVFELQRGNPEGATPWLNEACHAAPQDPQLRRLAETLRSLGSDPQACTTSPDD